MLPKTGMYIVLQTFEIHIADMHLHRINNSTCTLVHIALKQTTPCSYYNDKGVILLAIYIITQSFMVSYSDADISL